MSVMFLFYVPTAANGWRILNDISLVDFTNSRHKVDRDRRHWTARLYILHPLNDHIIDCLHTEFTASYPREYAGNWIITVETLSRIENVRVFKLRDEERDEVLRIVREYRYINGEFSRIVPLTTHIVPLTPQIEFAHG